MSQQLTTDLSTYFTNDTYSPYGLCKVVNTILNDLGLEKVLPPQMFYNYTSKGFITGTKGDKNITKEKAMEWTTKYLVRNYTN